MSLWNMLRDFLVQHIFGGTDSTGEVYENVVAGSNSTSDITFTIGGASVSLGDWLSTTTTIIVLILFVVLLFMLAKWLFKVVSGLVLLRN